METYAELLNRREKETMSNYDMDEIEREREKEKKNRGIRSIEKVRSVVEIGKDETPYTAVDIEISDDVFRKVAFQAHERDITFNKMVGLILKAELQSSEYRFEHHNSPQVLKEY
jgi:hypothetical protein